MRTPGATLDVIAVVAHSSHHAIREVSRLTQQGGDAASTTEFLPSVAGLQTAIDGAQQFLRSVQYDDGHWCGELEGDTILESEYILAMCFQGQLDDPRVQRAANTIRRDQLVDGGWAQYPGGQADVSISAKAYFVLKLVGDDARGRAHARARASDDPGASVASTACNSFTKIYLAIFGQYEWSEVPLRAARDGSCCRAGSTSTSTRCRRGRARSSCRCRSSGRCSPVVRSRTSASIRELALKRTNYARAALSSRVLDERVRSGCARRRSTSCRSRLSRPLRAQSPAPSEWILERLEESDGLGAIFPPIVNTMIALRALGYDADDPRLHPPDQMRELEKLEVRRGRRAARAALLLAGLGHRARRLNALVESGSRRTQMPVLQKAAAWLLDRRGHGEPATGTTDQEPGVERRVGLVLRVRQRVLPRPATTTARRSSAVLRARSS